MMKVLSFIVYLLRELVFDHVDELNYKSPKFDFKKVVLFAILILSFLLNVFLINRAFILAEVNMELKKEVAVLKTPKQDGKK